VTSSASGRWTNRKPYRGKWVNLVPAICWTGLPHSGQLTASTVRGYGARPSPRSCAELVVPNPNEEAARRRPLLSTAHPLRIAQSIDYSLNVGLNIGAA
jgi:hypothetical protein